MKRLISVLLILILFTLPAAVEQNVTEKVVEEYKKQLPIGKVVNYTTETDPNDLLGRPGQYIDKLSWEDKRIEQSEDDLKGGTIELFDSKENLNKREKYLKQFVESPMFAQYMYVHDLVIVRIDKELTPDQAEEYNTILENIKK